MEYKYKPEDFEDLLFNVHKAPKKESLLKEFPELQKYPEFTAILDKEIEPHKDRIIKYIVFMYDRNTPLTEIDDWNKRKIHAIRLAGSRPNKEGYFSGWVRNMLIGRNPEVNAMIIRYCRLQHPRIYGLLVAGNESYYNLLLDITSNESEKKDKDLFMKAEKMNKKLDAMTNELLNEAPDPELEKDLFRFIEEENIKHVRLTPEYMSKAS